MRRPLATIGITSLCTMMAAAMLLPEAFLLSIAVFAAAIFGFRVHKKAGFAGTAVVLAVAAALFWFCLYQNVCVRPTEQKSGQTCQIQAVVTELGSTYLDGYVQATLYLTEMDGQKSNLRLYCPMLPETAVGNVVTCQAALALLPDDSYKPGRYADGIYLQAKEPTAFVDCGPGTTPYARLLQLRHRLASSFYQDLPREIAGVAAAMVTGERSRLSSEIREDFRSAGLSHLLVVSGLHLSLLCGFVWVGAHPYYSRGGTLRAIAAILLALAMMAITGFTPSVCRAGIAIILYYGGILLQRPPDTWTSLAVAALILCAQNPYAGCDVGFQLSFAATAGVMLASETGKTRPEDERGMLLQLWKKAVQAVRVPLYAALFTMPVLLIQNMRLSGNGIPANLLTFWLVPCILLAGLLTILCSLLPFLAFVRPAAALLLGLATKTLCALAAFCAELPWANLQLPKTYTLLAWSLWVGLYCLMRFWKIRHGTLYRLAFLALAISLGTILQHGLITVAMLHTAQAPCAVIAQEQSVLVLLRGGPAGEQAIRSYLEEQGLTQINCLVDMRTNPTDLTLAADRVILVAQQATVWEERLCEDIRLEAVGDEEGTAVRVYAGGVTISATAGTPAIQATHTDLHLASSRLPEGLSSDAVLTNSTGYDWLPGTCATVYYGKEPEVVIRPACSCVIREAELLDLQ